MITNANKYISSLNQGLRNAQFKIKSKTLSLDSFFFELIAKTKDLKSENGRIFFFGNGASDAFSHHMALDWSKNGGIPSVSLSSTSFLTALANDINYESAFLEFLKLQKPRSSDLVVTTSSSGNSSNIVNLLEFCSDNQLQTFGLSGLENNNQTVKLATFSAFIDMKTYGMVECIHQILHHLWLDLYMGVYEWEKNEPQNMDINNFKL